MAALNAGAPRITDRLCEPCAEHFAAVRAHLDALGVAYRLEPGLVRGLDYYTRTAFEFYRAGAEGQQSALGGGGRYDGLVELLGGRPTPGIGFGLGLDRVVLALAGAGAGPTVTPDGARWRSSSARTRPHRRAAADRDRAAGGGPGGPRRPGAAQARPAARGGGPGRRALRGHPRRRAGRRARSSSATCRPAPSSWSRSPTSPASSTGPHEPTSTAEREGTFADPPRGTAVETDAAPGGPHRSLDRAALPESISATDAVTRPAARAAGGVPGRRRWTRPAPHRPAGAVDYDTPAMTDAEPRSLATPYRTHTCGELRGADAGHDGAPRRLGPPPARPRPADLPRPPRPPRHHPGRRSTQTERPAAHEVASRVRDGVRRQRRRRRRAAPRRDREREAADRRDRAPGDRRRDPVRVEDAAVPHQRARRPDRREPPAQVPLPRHPPRADAPTGSCSGAASCRRSARSTTPTASSRSRRRPSSSRRPRAPATSSSRRASSRAASTPCRRARSSSSSC